MNAMAELAMKESTAVSAHWSRGDRIGNALNAMGVFVSDERRTIMVEVVESVSEKSGVSVSEIMGRSGISPISLARQVAMWAAYAEGVPLACIAEFFGRDRKTIRHGVDAVSAVMGPAR